MKVLEREKLPIHMRMAFFTAMSPPIVQDFIYQQGVALTDYSGMVERVRTLVRTRVAEGGQ